MAWTIRDVDPDEHEVLVGLWRRAVEATHVVHAKARRDFFIAIMKNNTARKEAADHCRDVVRIEGPAHERMDAARR